MRGTARLGVYLHVFEANQALVRWHCHQPERRQTVSAAQHEAVHTQHRDSDERSKVVDLSSIIGFFLSRSDTDTVFFHGICCCRLEIAEKATLGY